MLEGMKSLTFALMYAMMLVYLLMTKIRVQKGSGMWKHVIKKEVGKKKFHMIDCFSTNSMIILFVAGSIHC